MNSTFLIEAGALAARLKEPGISVLDASWYMPAEKRDTAAEFRNGHIPGAVFFDIDAISDHDTPLPHMLVSPQAFQDAARMLGVGAGDEIVVYDTAGIFSAARVWWNFRLAGARKVYVLNGGLPAWRNAGLPVETGLAVRPDGDFEVDSRPELVHSFDEVMKLVAGDRGDRIVDARSRERFLGKAPDPRPGVAAGHIRGSRNVPFSEVLMQDGRLKPAGELRKIFGSADVDLDGPLVTSCGSGVTAAVLALALAELGRTDVAIYDGSWSEWGSRSESAKFVSTGN